MIYKQTVNHAPSGALGNLATFGGCFIAVAAMLTWKIKGWRWVAFALYVLLIFSDLHVLRKIPALSADSLPVISLCAVFFVLHAWAAYTLARGAATLRYLSEASLRESPPPGRTLDP